jgi:hypothetical protein
MFIILLSFPIAAAISIFIGIVAACYFGYDGWDGIKMLTSPAGW